MSESVVDLKPHFGFNQERPKGTDVHSSSTFIVFFKECLSRLLVYSAYALNAVEQSMITVISAFGNIQIHHFRRILNTGLHRKACIYLS